jgi:hypothetical protein
MTKRAVATKSGSTRTTKTKKVNEMTIGTQDLRN